MSWADMAKSVLETGIETFKTEVTYHSISAQAFYSAQGVFDAAHLVVSLRDDLDYSTVNPVLGVSLAQLETVPAQGDEIILPAGATYRVSDIQPDGQGGALLILEKV
jgi:hypothetical protein